MLSNNDAKARKTTTEFYTLTAIKKKKARYNVIFGQRSNGKTFAVLDEIIKNYLKKGEKGAYIRRYREDMRGLSAQMLFAAFGDKTNRINDLTKGQYNSVRYFRRAWYLEHVGDTDSDYYYDKEPFCYSFALTESKGANYPKVTTIHFDEFLDRKPELQGEFEIFINLVSTLVRNEDKAKIYLTANTVNQSSLYFREMGLSNIKKMSPGQIDVYEYGDSGLKTAVEYTAEKINNKSDVYFAFNNPHLQMITKGVWELGVYPHTTEKWTKDKVIFSAFLVYEDEIVQLDIISKDDLVFMFCHMKTTEIKDTKHDIILSFEDNPRYNYIQSLIKSDLRVSKRILWFFNNNKVYYQDNTVGEIVRNWLIKTGDMRYLKV